MGMDLENPTSEIATLFSDFVNNPAPARMEQFSEVVQRTGAFLKDIIELPGNILISTHAIAMKGALEYLPPASNGSIESVKHIANLRQESGKFIRFAKEIPD